MASSAVALPNGVLTPVSTHTNTNPDPDPDPAQSIITASTKRKREPSDAGENPPNRVAVNGVNTSSRDKIKIDQSTIRNYYRVLQRLDVDPSILKRPLPDPDSSEEPDPKRKKSEDGNSFPSVADKVTNEMYEDVDTIISDITAAITAQLAELRELGVGKDGEASDAAVAQTIEFKKQAYTLFRREVTYPKPTHIPEALRTLDSTNDIPSNASGRLMLTVFGEAPRATQLYSSLQHPVPKPGTPDTAAVRPLRAVGLPNGVRAVKAMSYPHSAAIDKDKKSKTLGELFPAPRNLASLPPPKAPKSTTKGVHVGWHRPELTEKSKYRAGSYFSQPISTGRWLDYSNAAPPSQTVPKSRERALSLAGNKPSSSELEMSEMEALFRGAFSSFAPTKDDSAAMISSGLISQTMWWQKVGQRNLDRLVDAELPESPADEADTSTQEPVDEVNEDLIQTAIENWDDTLVDPSLESACCPKKSDEEKDADDLLQEVSDMIQTLISYQKNRNLTLPNASSQSRYAADPAQSDMLTNGSPVQPSEEETATYQVLKAQLALIVQTLPPYAVARLNSDKLEELNISTKLEVRTDEYHGVMEEDEIAARARAAQAPAATARPATHRSSSSSSNVQYGQQYHPSPARTPMPTTPYYGAQTPVRPPQPSVQRPPQSMPANYAQRPQSNTGYRPQTSYPNTAYNQQYAKPQAPYSQPASYAATPTQTRPPYQQHGSTYSQMSNSTQQPRYSSYTHTPTAQSPAYQQPYQPQHQQPPQTPSTQAPYGQYMNGAGNVSQRNNSSQVHHSQSHHPQVAQQGYNPAPTPSRQSSYGSHLSTTNSSTQRFYQGSHTPAMPANPGIHQPQIQNQNKPSIGPSSYRTAMSPVQLQQAINNGRARYDSINAAQKSNDSLTGQSQTSVSSQGHVGAPVGLGGIGLGADSARMAARASMPGGMSFSTSTPSPSPQLHVSNTRIPPPVMNGIPPAASPTPATNGGTAAANRDA